MDKTQLAIYIGNKIKEYRKARGMLQSELSDAIGTTKNTISNYETGFRSPKKDTLFDLADALGVSIDDLFPHTNSKQKATPSDADLKSMLEGAKTYGGEPITEGDKQIIQSLLKAYIDNKGKEK